MRLANELEEPFGWWGPFAAPRAPRPLQELLRAGVVDPALVGLLEALMVRRTSLTVVAGPSGAGKTTLLTALLELLPPGRAHHYVRGCYESFDFLGVDESAVKPAVLVNEISPHLPIYLWGAGLRRLLEAAGDGYQVLATAHATSAADLIGQLAGYPLRLSASTIATLELVIWLDVWIEEGEVRRQVRSLERLAATRTGGIEVVPLARRERGQPASTLELGTVGLAPEDVERHTAAFDMSQGPKRRPTRSPASSGTDRSP